MEIVLDACTVRSWRAADAESLVRYANNRRIWDNLRDLFPHPYTIRAAREYLQSVKKAPETSFAIDVHGEAVGGVGFVLKTDVERVSAEIGYWLGEPFWGKGIATAALRAVTQHTVKAHGLTRIYALPFAHNLASCRVLEKAGYVLEGRSRRSAIKNGVVVDQMQYAYVVPEVTASCPPPTGSPR